MVFPSSLNARVLAKALCACALKISTRIKNKRTLNTGSYGYRVELLNFVSI